MLDNGPRTGRRITLDGSALHPTDIAALAERTAYPAAPDPKAFARAEESWETARRLAATGRVYGRSTGVGANRTEDVGAADADHGLRLLRSHAGAIGDPLPAREVRAMLAVRANQLLAGGAGLNPAVITSLIDALDAGAHPVVNEHGAVGTGDLAALAQTGLALAGEHPWHCAPGGRAPAPIALDNNDALALISSNALTLGQSALALDELRRLLAASLPVAALSLLAVGGSWEPFAEPVLLARPHPGSAAAATRLRTLSGIPPRPTPPLGRIQDPYGFRCIPQIHGPALDAADTLDGVLTVEVNAAAENPLISIEDQAAYHHGNFYAAHAALALDTFRLAVLQTARLSTARLAALSEPDFTRLRPFLGDAAPASSGVMILEYAAGAALGEMRAVSHPASLGHAVLSRGVEEQASFASLGARQTLRACTYYRQILACELVAAVRALRMRSLEPDPGLPLATAFTLAAEALDPRMEDRPLTDDVAVASGLLDGMAEL
ncbi:aromatic amino acid ammonia-lyase [Streptomyces sp. Isolate_219]|uniref:aromatic amino acid ammonia-lyase n=1 Tax=Streptomyces sp. Isolate_219 TaxID=2950110 RepID=UPI0021C592CE|nr:aromatic amino acid ammonia-lyase [Streptomyces sp. Isolate_219]MCR8577333.1 aromatic amino acid ammonia-lyase [Streptomyces sp. Isolate_219]